jgi:hypothetical protein
VWWFWVVFSENVGFCVVNMGLDKKAFSIGKFIAFTLSVVL